MQSLLARLSPRRALGVYVGDDEIAVSQVSSTVLGPVEIYRHSEKYEVDALAAALEHVFQGLFAKRRSRRLVAFSLPPLRVFFSTRPLKATNVDVSPKVLLHELLRSANTNVDEMAIDLVHVSPGKRPVVNLVSCRKKYLASVLESSQQCGIRPMQVEPSVSALMRVAQQQHKDARKAKVVVRIFLGAEERGLAVLAAGGWPIVPRSFKVAEPDVSSSLVSSVRTLATLGKHCGIDSAVDAVTIHGGAELRSQVDLQTLEEQIGVRTQWHDGPALDNRSVALGSALGCFKPAAQSFDLARSMKRRATLWELLPWGEVALQIAAVICLGLFLLNRGRDLDVTYAAVRSETDGRQWLKSFNEQQLEKERTNLEQRVKAISQFLSTRILWTEYTHDIPARLPHNATLNSFQGQCELERKAKKDGQVVKPKKSLVMRIGAPIAQDGAVPKEVDGFLDSLRENALLKRDFPLVDLADIKWYQPFVGAQPTAFFTVVCLPKPTNVGAVPAEGAEKTGKKSEH